MCPARVGPVRTTAHGGVISCPIGVVGCPGGPKMLRSIQSPLSIVLGCLSTACLGKRSVLTCRRTLGKGRFHTCGHGQSMPGHVPIANCPPPDCVHCGGPHSDIGQSGLACVDGPGRTPISKIDSSCEKLAGYIVVTVLPAGTVAPKITSAAPAWFSEGCPTCRTAEIDRCVNSHEISSATPTQKQPGSVERSFRLYRGCLGE